MRGRRRGPTPRPIDPRVKQLEAENRRLQRKLQRAETIIALQKKVATAATITAAIDPLQRLLFPHGIGQVPTSLPGAANPLGEYAATYG